MGEEGISQREIKYVRKKNKRSGKIMSKSMISGSSSPKRETTTNGAYGAFPKPKKYDVTSRRISGNRNRHLGAHMDYENQNRRTIQLPTLANRTPSIVGQTTPLNVYNLKESRNS